MIVCRSSATTLVILHCFHSVFQITKSDRTYEILLIGAKENGKRTLVTTLESSSKTVKHKTLKNNLNQSFCDRADANLSVFSGVDVVHIDTKDEVASEEMALSDAQIILDNHPNGFNSIVLVICFSNLVQGLVRHPLHLMKKAFGEESVRNHGVCVVTGKDEFLKRVCKRAGSENKTFDEWCNEQSGPIGKFLSEFDGGQTNARRVVLFDMDNDSAGEEDVKQLLYCLNCLPDVEAKYNREIFRKASERQKRV